MAFRFRVTIFATVLFVVVSLTLLVTTLMRSRCQTSQAQDEISSPTARNMRLLIAMTFASITASLTTTASSRGTASLTPLDNVTTSFRSALLPSDLTYRQVHPRVMSLVTLKASRWVTLTSFHHE